jgi:hypothetical protein
MRILVAAFTLRQGVDSESALELCLHQPTFFFLWEIMVIPKMSNNYAGSGVFGKKTQEYHDLLAMFVDGTVNPKKTKPAMFYNDPNYKMTYGKFSMRSFTSGWYNARKEAGLGSAEDEGKQRLMSFRSSKALAHFHLFFFSHRDGARSLRRREPTRSCV